MQWPMAKNGPLVLKIGLETAYCEQVWHRTVLSILSKTLGFNVLQLKSC